MAQVKITMKTSDATRGCARGVLAACVLAVGVCGPASARQAQADDGVAPDIRAMIMGPLQAEFAVSGASFAPRSAAYALRYQPGESAFGPVVSSRPAASRIASSLLTARASDAVTRDGLSAFSAAATAIAYTGEGAGFTLSLVDGESPSSARLAFDPDYAEAYGQALSPALSERHRRMAVTYEGSFDSPGGADGLDLGLSPRAGVSIGDDGPAARAGATVRLGQYLSEFESDRPAWWFFAGADRQAVLYDPGQGFDVRGALAMQPYAMIGDAQAGVAVRVRGVDLSVAYVHRETRYALPQQDWETTEGFAAFSLTLKR
jgi:hypothetical protein